MSLIAQSNRFFFLFFKNDNLEPTYPVSTHMLLLAHLRNAEEPYRTTSSFGPLFFTKKVKFY
jgi:hypothetical protein